MIKYLVFIIFSIFFSIFSGKLIAQTGSAAILIVLLAIIIFVITFLKRRFALVLIVLAILLSPQISIARIDVQRQLVIRIEDLVIVISSFAWIASVATNKGLALFKYSPMNRPAVFYIVSFMISTLVAAMFWPSPYFKIIKASFYILKYIEFFLIFFVFYNVIETEKDVKFFYTLFLITGVVAALYGISQIGRMTRIYAPFDSGEANTFGGFLDMYLAFCFSFFLYGKETKSRLLYGFLWLLFFIPLLNTLSRSSYLSFIALYVYLIFRAKKGRGFLALLLIIGLFLAPIVFPQKVFNRVTYTFSGSPQPNNLEENIFVPTLDLSSQARLKSGEWAFNKWLHHPIFGYGISGIAFIDGQYIRTLAEGGLLTFAAFIWLLVSIWKSVRAVEKESTTDFMKKFSFAMELIFVVLVVHSITANSFIITRIQENLWMLLGLLMSQYKKTNSRIDTAAGYPAYGNFISR